MNTRVCLKATAAKINTRSAVGAALLATGLLVALPSEAFNVFPYGTDQALKWGDNTVGTPGGTVTWSLMADGTGLDASAPAGIHGTSQLGSIISAIDGAYGTGTTLNIIQTAFTHWSAQANISFQQVTETGAVPFSAPYAAVGSNTIGSIRIGAFNIDGFSGAVGYAAPPNGGTTLEGDIILNLNVAYQVAAGAEGSNFFLYPWPSPTSPGSKDGWYHNDLEGLIAHELGHALGLAHSSDPNALMCGYVSSGFDGSTCSYFDQPPYDSMVPINRLPKADDIAGIQYLYGAAVPEPGSWAMWLGGLALLGWLRGRMSRPVTA